MKAGNKRNVLWFQNHSWQPRKLNLKKTEETLETHDPTFMNQQDKSLNEKV